MLVELDGGELLGRAAIAAMVRSPCSQVQPGRGLDALGGDGVQVALAQHDVVRALHLDLVAVLGAEQHEVADLGGAHVLAEGDDLGPHQPLGHLRRRRDEDAALGAPLAVLVRDPHQQPVVEHLDGQLVVGGAGHDARVPSGHVDPTAASVALTTADGVTLTADVATAERADRGRRAVPPAPAVRRQPPQRRRRRPVPDAAGRGHHGVALRLPARRRRRWQRPGRRAPRRRRRPRRARPRRARPAAVPVGYSFGAGVALGVDDPGRARSWPSRRRWPSCPCPARRPCRRSCSCPPTTSTRRPPWPPRAVAGWPAVTVETIEAADHFLVGRAAVAADRATAWLVAPEPAHRDTGRQRQAVAIPAGELDRAGTLAPMSDLRSRFPGVRDGWARFDGPAGTQMVDTAITAMAEWAASGDNANSGGAFAAADASDALLERARNRVAELLGGRARRRRVRRQHDDADARLHAGRRRHAAPRRTGSSAPGSTTTPTSRRGGWRASRPAPSTCWRRSTRRPGILDPAAVIDLIDERTAWVAVTGASNLLGTIPDLAPIVAAAHDAGARVFVDAVHLAPHRRIDVAAIGCDVLVTSPYKWYGPHAGVLCADPALLDELPVAKVRPAADRGPRRWETGTPSFEAIAAIDAAAALPARRGPRPARRRRGRGVRAAARRSHGDRRRHRLGAADDGRPHADDRLHRRRSPARGRRRGARHRAHRHVGRPLLRRRGRRPARPGRPRRRRARRRRRLRRRRGRRPPARRRAVERRSPAT